MAMSKYEVYGAFLQAHEAGEPQSAETMDALADLMRAELANRKGKPKRGRPRQKFKDLRRSSKLKAALEVEDRVSRGETYTKARDELTQTCGTSKRNLERYGKIAKHLRPPLLAIQQTVILPPALLQTLAPFNAITQAFAGLVRPFAMLAHQSLSPEGDCQEIGETASPKNRSELLSSPDSSLAASLKAMSNAPQGGTQHGPHDQADPPAS
jgi:hypothetical protein